MKNERGQVAILMVLVVLVGLLLITGLGLFAQAVVHRARSQSAADAIALAIAGDPDQAPYLIDWYADQGIRTRPGRERTRVNSGPSQAGSRAEGGLTEVSTAPALVAIVARAEQLVGLPISPVRWDGTTIELAPPDADRLALVAAELGLCPGPSVAGTGNLTFELC